MPMIELFLVVHAWLHASFFIESKMSMFVHLFSAEYTRVMHESFAPEQDSIQAREYCSSTHQVQREVLNNELTIKLLDMTVFIIM